MLCMIVVLEDDLLQATYVNTRWQVVLSDIVTGKTFEALWTNRELAAVLALAVGSEDFGESKAAVDNTLYGTLYALAEPLFAKPCPPECRLIP